MAQVNFKELLKFPNFIEIFYCCKSRLKSKKWDVSWPYLFTRTTVKKGKSGTIFKFHNFNEIFYWGMTRNQEHEGGRFSTISMYIGTILTKRNRTSLKDKFKETVKNWQIQWNCFTVPWTNVGTRKNYTYQQHFYKQHQVEVDKKWCKR